MSQKPYHWDHHLEYAALSDVGLRRPNNQDSLRVALASSKKLWQQQGHMFVVADGMGAHAAGELASKLAVETVEVAYRKLRQRSAPKAALEAMHEANAKIYKQAQASQQCRGMGTTASALVLLPQAALVVHVGDSRIYRLRGNRFEQLTFDHSLVWELYSVEEISAGQLPDYIPKNVLTRAVGRHPQVEVDLEGPFPLRIGDTFLLCSDGLSGLVEDRESGTILRCLPLDEAVRVLVDLALLRGGADNITVIAVRVTGPQPARRADDELAASSGRSCRAVHLLFWTTASVFILAGLGLIAAGYPVAGLVGVVGALTSAVVVLVRRYAKRRPGYRFQQAPLGNGPYTQVDCTPNEEFVDRLVRILAQLREIGIKEGLDMQCSQFNASGRPLGGELSSPADGGSAAAGQPADHAQAVRAICRSISSLMGRLRDQYGQKAPREDSM